MHTLSLDGLLMLLRDSDERDESSKVELTPAVADSPFDELGFDSLSLLNVVEGIKQRFDIDITYELAVTAKTPRELLALLQGRSKGSE